MILASYWCAITFVWNRSNQSRSVHAEFVFTVMSTIAIYLTFILKEWYLWYITTIDAFTDCSQSATSKSSKHTLKELWTTACSKWRWKIADSDALRDETSSSNLFKYGWLSQLPSYNLLTEQLATTATIRRPTTYLRIHIYTYSLDLYIYCCILKAQRQGSRTLYNTYSHTYVHTQRSITT